MHAGEARQNTQAGAARRFSPAKLGWVTLALTAVAVQGQAIAIRGRVLERAGMQPVPGAAVRLLGASGLTAVTDSKGVFKIAAGTTALGGNGSSGSAANAGRGLGEGPLSRQGFRWRDPAGDRDAAGREAPHGPGDAAAPAGSGFSGPAGGSGFPALAPAAKPAAVSASGAGPGPLEVTCPGLVTRQVPAMADSADLGDIALEYPPRKFDLGVRPIYGAIVLFDGSRALMDSEWGMWMGTFRKTHGLGPTPLAWEYLKDPVDSGMTMRTCCSIQWGDEDLVTKRKFTDFQLHIEFNPVSAPRTGAGAGPANAGVYLQSFYEIQIKDDYGLNPLGNHDAGGILNETAAPVNLCRPRGQWQAYDITYRAARFKNGIRSEKARLTLYWNGQLTHLDKETANEHAYGVSSDSLVDEPKGLKLQSEGHDVRFRNVWIKELDLAAPNTAVGY